MKHQLILLLILSYSFAIAEPQNATRALELKIEKPTLISLGFDWNIEGDENLNAKVSVTYREVGENEWREYLPLFRTGRGRMADYGFNDFPDPNFKQLYRIPDGFAGSIMDLEPDTEYEVKLELTDPDGVIGKAVRQFILKTRPEPMPFQGGEVRHVYPTDYKGEKEQPAYNNLMHAVNGFQTWCDNYQTIHPNRARPGTIIKVHAGVYKTDYHDYRDPGGLWLHGMQTFTADGEPGKPIAIVAAGDGEVVFDANGSDRYFNIAAADYLYFEGFTIKNTRIAFYAGLQGLEGSTGLTVKNCRIENVQYGILAQDARSENFYIADNVFIGKNPIDRFNPESSGAFGRTEAGYAVNLAGQGHVVCYNYVASFWDGINVFTNSLADPELGQQSRSIDFYNNDIYNINDNFIEADGGYANIRILRNRCFNGMSQPLSTQPVYSGPVYWIRNIVFNASQGAQTFKMVNGDNVLFYHNTSTSHHSHYNLHSKFKYVDVRNNLFMGPVKFVKESQKKRELPIFLVMHDDERSIVYITIVSNEDYPTYTLSYPNQEVRDSLLRYLLAEYSRGFASEVPVKVQHMKKMLEADNLTDFVQALNSLFASIPHQIFIADKEAFYHAVTFLALSLMDTYIQAEVSQAHGRPDAVVYTESTIYILEFKLDESAEVALNQIKDRNYAAPYLNAGKKLKAVGFNFNSQQKTIDQWLEEVVG